MVTPRGCALLLAPVALLACGDDLGPRVPAAIAVTPAAPEVLLNGSLQLDATVVDATGRAVGGGAFTFRSSADSILSVSETGLLTSAGRVGSAVITARSGDLTAEVEATVVLPRSALVVTPASLELDTGEGAGLTAVVTDENGEPVPDAEVAFAVDDISVVRVTEADGIGLVRSLAAGEATVRVASGGLTTEVPVTVTRIPSFARVTPGSLVLPPGTSQRATAALLDRTGDEIDLLHPFTWSSSNEAVATVDGAGLITSVGPEGSAVITATVDTFTATLGVFVGTPPRLEIAGRTTLDWAEGVAVTSAGVYFVAGFDRFVRGALPSFDFSLQVPVNGNAADVVLNRTHTRAYIAGLYFAGWSWSGVGVLDLSTDTLIDSIPVRLGRPWSAALSGLGTVLTIGTDRGFELIDLSTGRSLGAAAVGFVPKITNHPLKPLLYATAGGDVLELDDRTGAILRRFPGDAGAHVLTEDGSTLYTISRSPSRLDVWNLETGIRERTLPAPVGGDIALSPDGRFLYVLHDSDHIVGGSRLHLVDPGSGALLRTVLLGGLAQRLAVATDGTVIVTNQGGAVGWVDFVRTLAGGAAARLP